MLHAVRMDSRSRNVLCRCAHTRVMYWAVSHVRYGPDAEISETRYRTTSTQQPRNCVKILDSRPVNLPQTTPHQRLPFSIQ